MTIVQLSVELANSVTLREVCDYCAAFGNDTCTSSKLGTSFQPKMADYYDIKLLPVTGC